MMEPQNEITAASSLRPKGRKMSTKQQIETRTVNGVTTISKTETIIEDGVETVNVYENNKLGKTLKYLILLIYPSSILVKRTKNGATVQI